uniref:Uncharacterized protein n=1 Tax=Percolomonas cosmopolitus TaxID=63605 RepID=A0A7S1PJV5_9EUKA|mmetsp:Transcript_7493/g.28118  ORF Transcript_7493/g.28118 Transcript_7493/m.28118 type:complete len:171 (+) Transcript_7493:138-650(+)|eukprot:CAMPEP_0117436904 /NCGR_PEP_ID=MMETSP0759-20121206/1246_1 /TAXON_ID=63605 /ORGANISM="Percolomonas cosmopolitus, Strain WS" /LENGTH=170 /DNA_ID=CAMNT_0005228515 /DNA_START=143 /DNA_END=655 /DNA_ORIENTATION=+
MSYADPRRRVLQSYQIGLSSHKNSYSRGTLVGNFLEERSYDANDNAGLKFEAQSTMKESFSAYDPQDVKRREVTVRQGMGQDSLFRHQNGSVSRFVTTNNLTFTNNDVDFHNTRTDALLTGSKQEPQAPPRTSLLEQKRQQWEKERQEVLDDAGATFKTTYTATLRGNAQ